MSDIIATCRITEMPKSFGDPMPKVIVTLQSDLTKEIVLFEYYPDEISFTPDEFIGLSTEQGSRLKYKKDVNYLRS